MFLAELKKNLIEFYQVINSYFTEKYHIHNTRSFIQQWGKSLMHRPKGELLSHITSQASLHKSLCLVNQHQQKMVLHLAAPLQQFSAPKIESKEQNMSPHPHSSSQPSLTH